MSSRGRKRPIESTQDDSTPKRSRSINPSDTSSSSRQQLSVREQAEPYRLITAIFPIDVLTPVWRHGTNRPIHNSHKRHLCQAFREGLYRIDAKNALRLVCTQDEVARMMTELERQGGGHRAREDWKYRRSDSWPSFLDWARVNDQPIELLAGHHRVEALKTYLKEERLNAPEERWWLCDVYDQGKWVLLITFAPPNYLKHVRL